MFDRGRAEVIVGSGVKCADSTSSCGDGGDPRDAQLNSPYAMTFTKDGELVIADSGTNRLRLVSRDGRTITTFAGNGKELPLQEDDEKDGKADNGDGGLAGDAIVGSPLAVVAERDAGGAFNGNILVGDSSGGVRRITPDEEGRLSPRGNIRRIAGGGHQQATSEFQDATQVNLSAVQALAATHDGGFVASSLGEGVVKFKEGQLRILVSPSVHELASSDVHDAPTDGRPEEVTGLVEDPGDFSIVLSGLNFKLEGKSFKNIGSVWRLSDQGLVKLIGTNSGAFNGDNIPADTASLGNPAGDGIPTRWCAAHRRSQNSAGSCCL